MASNSWSRFPGPSFCVWEESDEELGFFFLMPMAQTLVDILCHLFTFNPLHEQIPSGSLCMSGATLTLFHE